MKKALAAAAVAAMFAAPAFAQNIAIVNGKPVPKSRMDVYLGQLAQQGRPIDSEMQDKLKQDLIMREIFVQEAQKRGLESSETVKKQMDQMRENWRVQMELMRESVLIRELLSDWQKKNPVTDAEVKAEYDRVVGASGGKEYKARHILVEKEDEAKAIIASLKKGGKFEEIAKKQSKDPGSGAKGGDLDWATADSYVPEFAQALVKLNKGQVSETPVKSQFGWHILRVDDIRAATPPKLEEVKPQIVEMLQQVKLEKYRDDLRKAAKVE